MPVVGIVLLVVGMSLWNGWWLLLGIPIFAVGLSLTQVAFQALRDGNTPASRRIRAVAVVVLAFFFVSAGAFFSWVLLSPDSGCSDCDGPWVVPAAIGLNIALWAFAALLVWQARRPRPTGDRQ
jgi:hypothetical protein